MKLYPSTITSRFWAFVLDYIILTLFYIGIAASAVVLDSIFSFDSNLSLVFIFVCIAIFLFYPFLCETFFHGQTIGKKIIGIRVVNTEGSAATGTQCLQRYLLLPFDILLTSGFGGLICALVTERRQRFGDIVAGTMVVKVTPHQSKYNEYMSIDPSTLTPAEKEIYDNIYPYANFSTQFQPLELAKLHRNYECDIARLRTHKSNPTLIEYLESQLSGVHIAMFKHRSYSFTEAIAFVLRSVPRAVYESRKSIYLSILIVIVSYLIGIYSQVTDPDFFKNIFGSYYTETTLDNIADGDPMGIYKHDSPMNMFFSIFLNNLMVTLRIYAMGIFTIVGPLFMLANNFVSFSAFDVFFAQHGLLADALVTTNQHGILELSSIIIVGGASIRLGTGWLFPGRMSRLKAWSRAARQSVLILISTLPMLFVAAFIESFVTRHTEWPIQIRLIIITVSSLIILLYYVMLPLIAKRQ